MRRDLVGQGGSGSLSWRCIRNPCVDRYILKFLFGFLPELGLAERRGSLFSEQAELGGYGA